VLFGKAINRDLVRTVKEARMLRWSVRSLMLAVILAAVFLAGIKVGRRTPALDGPGPRAMAFVNSVTTSSDREATAIFDAAKTLETSHPGFLRTFSEVKATPESNPKVWEVVFINPTTKQRQGVGIGATDAAVKDFVRKRDQGFEIIAR
jgi:hypothetical protein